MTNSILLAGVGGQGTILVSRVLTEGLVRLGFDVKMSEVHGMAQRGGSVSTQVRYGDKVHSPIIGRGEADALIAFEKMEAVRYAPFLRPGGKAVINDHEIPPLPVATGQAAYPQGLLAAMQAAFPCVVVPAARIAAELGNPRCMNIVLLGALAGAKALPDADWQSVLRDVLPPKLIAVNLAAFERGCAFGGAD